VHVPLLIGGLRVETGDWLPVTNPANARQVVGYAALASEHQAHQAVVTAQAAWKGWAALAPSERAQLVTAALGCFEQGADERIDLLVRENGKVRLEAGFDVGGFVGHALLAASLAQELTVVERLPWPSAARSGELNSAGGGAKAAPFRSEVWRVPVGVVSIIVPYNWPFAILGATLPYALIAGNTVIVKPPPTAPLSLSLTLQRLADALPAGVLSVVNGSNANVAPLITAPQVGHVVFTGSTAAGKTVMNLASQNVTRVTLELGGNDPAFILEDAALDPATLQKLVLSSFSTSGQICMAIKRMYVHHSRYDELVEGLSAALNTLRVGDGLTQQNMLGPLNNAQQRQYVRSLLEEARAGGHEVRELGEVDANADTENGHFLRPALVLEPRPNLRIVTEEQFGPALPILSYRDLEPLIEQVNGEWCGLSSSVWTTDLERGAEIARRLRTGTTWINNASAMAIDERAPFGGFRQSGLGRELGREGLLGFTESHTVTYCA
jgi:acyl-CoA reductase-like NAD-dependent aldehyde dehydrogenase